MDSTERSNGRGSKLFSTACDRCRNDLRSDHFGSFSPRRPGAGYAASPESAGAEDAGDRALRRQGPGDSCQRRAERRARFLLLRRSRRFRSAPRSLGNAEEQRKRKGIQPRPTGAPMRGSRADSRSVIRRSSIRFSRARRPAKHSTSAARACSFRPMKRCSRVSCSRYRSTGRRASKIRCR